MVIRGPFTEDTLHISGKIIEAGYKPVTFLQYWSHVIFWKMRKRRAEKAKSSPSQKKS